jgi:hypothetical protein
VTTPALAPNTVQPLRACACSQFCGPHFALESCPCPSATELARALADDMLKNNPSVGQFEAWSREDEEERWVVIFAKGEQAQHVRSNGIEDPCFFCGLPEAVCACDDEEGAPL